MESTTLPNEVLFRDSEYVVIVRQTSETQARVEVSRRGVVETMFAYVCDDGETPRHAFDAARKKGDCFVAMIRHKTED